MKTTGVSSISEYLESLPEDRRAILKKVRALVKKNIPKGYEEKFLWGMISWQVPLKVYPDTYNGHPLSYVCLASQKNHMALYLMCAYGDPKLYKRLVDGFQAEGKKLDMGKSCLRFKRNEDLAVEPIANVIAAVPMADFVAFTKKVHGNRKK